MKGRSTLLERLEAALEQAIEGGLARLGGGVQPLEVARRLQAAMTDARLIGPEYAYVPNRYQVRLADEDFEVFAGVAEDIAEQLSAYLEQCAREESSAYGHQIRVELKGGAERRGRIEVAHQFEDSAPGARLLIESGQPGGNFAVGERAVIGRDPDCEVQLTEGRVSRRHVQLEWTYRGYLLRDLGSRNGTFVNGVQVDEAILADGDLLEVGLVQLRFDLPE